MKAPQFFLFILSLIFISCSSQKNQPYACGPVLKQKNIESAFVPLIEILGLEKGDVFADVGASSGVYDIVMATLTEDVTYYIQDIDTDCLNPEELDKIIQYYSEQSGQALAEKNHFHITIGEFTQTNLPDNTFDVIYTNGTVHVFSDKEKMMKDIYTKLKPNAYLFIRDDIVKEGEIKFCPEDGEQLVNENELLQLLNDADFTLVEKIDDLNGYPLFKFQKLVAE